MNNLRDEYLPPDNHTDTKPKKIFTLAPAEDDLTSRILSVRIQVIEDSDLDEGSRLMFVYLLDLSLRRTTNVRPGVVPISQTKLAQKFNRCVRTIYAWKTALIEKDLVWMTQQPMPNTWPIDVYHITAIDVPNHFESRTTSEGLWGNGRRRTRSPQSGLGAREPGQRHLPGVLIKSIHLVDVRGNPLPRSEETPENAQVLDFAGVARNPLRLSAATGCGRGPQPTAGDARSPLRATPATGCRHKEAKLGGKELPEDGEAAAPAPPVNLRSWEKKLSKLFPRELAALKDDLVKQQKAIDPIDQAAVAEISLQIEAIDVELYGRPAPKRQAPARKAPQPAAPAAAPTAEELLEGARYLVATGKTALMTAAQKEALKRAGD